MTGAGLAACPAVAIIASAYAPDLGGVEEHVRHLAAGLLTRGYLVEVWTPFRRGLPVTEVLDGVRVRRLPTPLPNKSVSGVLGFLGRVGPAARAWRSALRSFRPDVLHVQCYGPNGAYGHVLGRATGVPVVVSLHGETFMDDNNAFEQSWLLRTMIRRSLRSAPIVTACSQIVLDDAIARYDLPADKGTVIFNGVDPDEVGKLDSTSWVPPVGRYVLGLGRVVPNKGFDLLIDAFAAVAATRPDVGLVIAGDGSARHQLQNHVDELGLTDRVTLVGAVDRAAVAAAMAGAELFVMPSRIEPFGIVLLEAWRAERAVVATTRGGAREFVRDGVDGLLVDPFDTSALASAIGRVVDEPGLQARLGATGRERLPEFTIERVVDDYVAVYGALSPLRGG